MAFSPGESQPEKQKVASPMFTRWKAFSLKSFAGACCAHERITIGTRLPTRKIADLLGLSTSLKAFRRVRMLGA